MANKRQTIIGIIVYLLLLTALCVPLFIPIIRNRTIYPGGNIWCVLGLMWCPSVAGMATRIIFQKTLRGVGWRWGKWKYQWASYLIPLVYPAVVYVPFLAVGYGDYARKAHNALVLVHSLHLPVDSPPGLVLVSIVSDLTVGVIPNCIAALGEELGWRGFLVPELAKITSFKNVAWISGVIWALYHFPVILGADYLGSAPRWSSVLCFTLQIMSLSFIYAWMRLKSGSVWTAVILHGMHNLVVQGIFDNMIRHTRLTNWVVGEGGIGIGISSGIIAYFLWRRDRQPALN
jgi:membrane protease YdiL (CAAX protease family)